MEFIFRALGYVQPLAWPIFITGTIILWLAPTGNLGLELKAWLPQYKAWLIILTILTGAMAFTQAVRSAWGLGVKLIGWIGQRRSAARRRANLLNMVRNELTALSAEESAVMLYLYSRNERSIVGGMGDQPFAALEAES